MRSQGCPLQIKAERWFLFGGGSSSGCCNESCGCGGRQHRGGRKIDKMMNKNVAAFLYNVMRGWNMDEQFIEKLLRATVVPELVADMDNCHWDSSACPVLMS